MAKYELSVAALTIYGIYSKIGFEPYPESVAILRKSCPYMRLFRQQDAIALSATQTIDPSITRHSSFILSSKLEKDQLYNDNNRS